MKYIDSTDVKAFIVIFLGVLAIHAVVIGAAFFIDYIIRTVA